MQGWNTPDVAGRREENLLSGWVAVRGTAPAPDDGLLQVGQKSSAGSP